MTEALKYFLDDSQILKETEDPDEGIDYIFMLESAEWTVLENEWDKRSEEWKGGIAYFAGFCRLISNKEILLKAISDTSKDVYEQGLLSLHQSITEEIEETGKFFYQLSENEKEVVINRLNQTSEKFKKFPEYTELSQILTE